jgi:hypothetical protein
VKRPADQKVSEYPFRYQPKHWHLEARTRALRCDSCTRDSRYQPKFYGKYEVHVSQEAGDLPHLHVRPRERVWFETPGTPVQVPAQTDEEQQMGEDDEMEKEGTTKPTVKEKAKDHFGGAGQALALGLKLAAVNEGGEILLDIAKEIAKDVPAIEALLESPEGREVAKMMVAFTVSGMCSYTDFVPKQEIVKQLMEMQMTASGFQLAAPRMGAMRKYFERLAGIGEKLAEVGEGANVMSLPAAKARVASSEIDQEQEEVAVPRTNSKARGQA